MGCVFAAALFVPALAAAEFPRWADTASVVTDAASITMGASDPSVLLARRTQMDPVRVFVEVPEADAALVRPKAKADVSVPAMRGRTGSRRALDCVAESDYWLAICMACRGGESVTEIPDGSENYAPIFRGLTAVEPER